MRIVGLTGNIAAGKTTVASTLAEAGLTVIDCDALAHASAAPGAWGYRRVLAAFGPGVTVDPGVPGSPLDRAALGALAFADPAARRALNAATHLPITVALLLRLLAAWAACTLVVVVDMPLLFETGAWRATRPRILVDAPPGVRRARLMARDGLDGAAADARLAAQAPADWKRARCALVIDNEGSLADVRAAAAGVAVAVRRGAWVHALVTPPALLAGVAVVAGLCGGGRWF
jgi:dephospho-CoA kinase